MTDKEKTRQRVQRYRDKKKALQKGVEALPNVTPVLESVTLDVTPVAILNWLIPGEKREKLGRILGQFGKRQPLLECTYLCGLPLDDVAELFEVTC